MQIRQTSFRSKHIAQLNVRCCQAKLGKNNWKDAAGHGSKCQHVTRGKLLNSRQSNLLKRMFLLISGNMNFAFI